MIKKFLIDDYVNVNSKRFALNLNVYRNAHYQVLNNAKKNFKQMLYANYPELMTITAQRVRVSYNVIPCDNRKFDLMNVIAIVDKFFMDALVNAGCIPDDSTDYVLYDRIYASIKQGNDCKKIEIKCNFF